MTLDKKGHLVGQVAGANQGVILGGCVSTLNVATGLSSMAAATATPPCNTGVEHGGFSPCRVAVDHVTLASETNLKGVFELLKSSSIGGDVNQWDGAAPRYGYEEAVTHPDRHWLLYYGRKEKPEAFCLQLHGKGCTALGLVETVALCRDIMMLMGVHCTRVDFCVDIFNGRGAHLLDSAAEAVASGQCHRKGHRISLSQRIQPRDLRKVTGDTLYMGSRASEVFGRWYDKGLESATATEGQVIRLEVELKKSRANTALIGLVLEDDIQGFVVRHILGAFEFSNGRGRLPWYKSLMALLGESTVAAPPADPASKRDFDKWLDWHRGSTGPMRRFHAIAAEVSRRTGERVSAGWVMDQLFPYLPCYGRKLQDTVTMAAAAVLVEMNLGELGAWMGKSDCLSPE